MQKTPLSQILRRLGDHKISVDKTPEIFLTGAAVDSRLYHPGQLFFALKGGKEDGHSYLAEVAAKGASAAVVDATYEGPSHGLLLIRVQNPLRALQELAKATLGSYPTKVVAVTGSLGKTTTKGFISTLLQERYRVAASPGNSNSQIGAPLAILNEMTGNEEIWVQEMGMTHPGQILDLIKIAPPTIAVLTTVALVHACNFGSLREIAVTKGEIFSHPQTTLGILSRDIEDYSEVALLGACRKVSFSTENPMADYKLSVTKEGIQITSKDDSCNLPPLNIPGRHNLHNFLAAVAVARNLGLTWDQIRSGMSKLHLLERRLEHIEKKGILFINDSYNASAVSVKAALESLPAPKSGGKRIAVIGEMLELGQFSAQCHLDVAEAALGRVDSMICMGKACEPIVQKWEQEKRPVVWSTNLSKVVEALQQQVKAGDVVLLKGSRANRLWEVLAAYEG